MIALRGAAALALAFAFAQGARAAAPLTLDEALAVAARANPDLAIARADADSARADRTASLGAVLPRLDLGASFGREFSGARRGRILFIGGTRLDLPATEATDEADYGLSLQLSQPVFDWRAFLDVRRAGASARAAEHDLDEVALSVAFEVTRRFYEVVRSERTLAVLTKTVARSEDLVARSEALFSAGRAPKSDTLQARVNLANDRVAVEAQGIRVAQARHALAQSLGLDDPEGVSAVSPALLDGPIPSSEEPPPLEELLRIARTRRPAAAAQAARVEAADASAGSARGGWLPTLTANASYGRQGSSLGGYEGVYDLASPSRAYSANARLVLSWNLFDGHRTSAGLRRAEAVARRARASLERTEVEVAKETADARAAVGAQARSVAIAAESLAVAEQGLALARERLEAGLASQLEIRDASLKLTQAELSLLQSRIDHALARADLSRALGGAP